MARHQVEFAQIGDATKAIPILTPTRMSFYYTENEGLQKESRESLIGTYLEHYSTHRELLLTGIWMVSSASAQDNHTDPSDVMSSVPMAPRSVISIYRIMYPHHTAQDRE